MLNTINQSPTVETKKEVEFYAKENYGTTMFYLVDKILLINIEALTGRKTLTARDFIALENLGFTFREVINPNRTR